MDTEKEGKWIFIINPTAGNGFAESLAPVITGKIKEYKIKAEIVFTERPGHAEELSQFFYQKGFRHIVGVGGDGTLNEVARPLVSKTDAILGVVPAGTGNDFNQITGFPDRFTDKEWGIFFRKNLATLDAGTVNGKIFINGMGLGFDAQVAAENYTEPGKVKKGGKHKYLWHIIKTLLFYREKRIKVTGEHNKYEGDCFINTIAVGRRFAGGFLLTPKALADDGLLDVCMIKRLNLFQRFRLLLKVPEGLHITSDKVIYYQTSGLNLEFSETVPFHVDGELFFAKEFKTGIIPGALTIIYNPDGNHFFRRDQ